jgi:hypothetical protein
VTARSGARRHLVSKMSMDLFRAIQDLYAEKEKLERVIASLEQLQSSGVSAAPLPQPVKRRGRKSMNSKERQEVSKRMKKYWESRRGNESSSGPVSGAV